MNASGPAGPFVKKRPPFILQYYRIEDDYKRQLGIDVVNESEILDGDIKFFIAQTWNRGFHNIKGRPLFRHNKKRGNLPSDFNPYNGWWIVSDRMKDLLEDIDLGSCVFLQCDLQLADGSMGPPIWLCDVVRTIDAFDEGASDIEIVHRSDGQKRYDRIGRKISMRSDLDKSFHVFRLKYSPPHTICDEEFRQKCRSCGIRGVRFLPILPN